MAEGNYATGLACNLFALQQKQVLCDVTLSADDGDLLAHGTVLAAASQFLCEKLQLLGCTNNKAAEFTIDLPGCSMVLLKSALSLIYTGVVHLHDDVDLQAVFSVCTSLGVDSENLRNVVVVTAEANSSSTRLSEQQMRETANNINSSSHVIGNQSDMVKTGDVPVSQSPSELFVVIEHQLHQQPMSSSSSSSSSSHSEHTVTKCLARTRLSSQRRLKRRSELRLRSGSKSRSGSRSSSVPRSESLLRLGSRSGSRLSSRSESRSKSRSGSEPWSESRSGSGSHSLLSSRFGSRSLVGRHECASCGKRYQSARYLHAHQLSHAGLKPVLCESCGRGFYTAVNLHRHVLLRHGGPGRGTPPPQHVCDRCGKSFVAASRLRRHMSETHDSTARLRHSCHWCSATFANAGNLQRHCRLHSTQPRPHICTVCGKSFTQKTSLDAHSRLHDLDARRRAVCVCPVCCKQLSKSSNLRKHLLLHAPRPPT